MTAAGKVDSDSVASPVFFITNGQPVLFQVRYSENWMTVVRNSSRFREALRLSWPWLCGSVTSNFLFLLPRLIPRLVRFCYNLEIGVEDDIMRMVKVGFLLSHVSQWVLIKARRSRSRTPWPDSTHWRCDDGSISLLWRYRRKQHPRFQLL